MHETVGDELINLDKTFAAEFNNDETSGRKSDSRLHIVITNGFVEGHYSGKDFSENTRVVGAINSWHEMMLIESENGKIIRTFQGKFKNKGERLILLKGIWKGAKETTPAEFSNATLARF